MQRNNPILTFVFFVFSTYLAAQGTLSGNVGRIYDAATSSCSYTILPTAIYPVTVQWNNLTSGTSGIATTGTTGGYSIASMPQGLVTLSTSAGTQYLGLSTFDLVLIQRHINQAPPFQCPLTRIGSDVNNDGKITTTDIDIIRSFILGTRTNLPVPPWRFVPRAYVTQSQYHPDPKFTDDFWNNAYANNNGIEYPFNAVLKHNGKFYTYLDPINTWMNKMEAWPFDQNAPCGIPEYGFYGVPSGDANYSASTFSVPFAPPTKEEILSFERILMERTSTLRSGEGRYEVTITAVSSVDVYGYQLGVKFDEKSYEYEKVKSGNQELKQDDRNYNTKNEKTIKGELRTSWVSDLSKTSKIPATKEFGTKRSKYVIFTIQ